MGYTAPMALPSDIKLLTELSKTRLVFPVRVRTAPRVVCFVPIIFGMIFSGFAIFWMLGASGLMEDNRPAPAVVGPEAPEAPDIPAPVPPQRAIASRLKRWARPNRGGSWPTRHRAGWPRLWPRRKRPEPAADKPKKRIGPWPGALAEAVD